MDNDANDFSSHFGYTHISSAQGISKAFLRDHLYSPFAQEDSLATGTGLGLSLARSIVSMLDGTIDVESDEGKGTEVMIRLPMRRKVQAAASQSLPDPGVTINRRETDPIAVRGLAEGKTIALFGFDSVKMESSTFKAVGETLAYYVTEWYGSTVPRCGTSSVGLLQAIIPSIHQDPPLRINPSSNILQTFVIPSSKPILNKSTAYRSIKQSYLTR